MEKPAQVALVDIETTGLTPGYDQITVIGLADVAGASRVFVVPLYFLKNDIKTNSQRRSTREKHVGRS